MLRAITMTAYRRPEYTRQVLDALSKCEGIGDWLLLPRIEPGNEEVIAAFEGWTACESRVVVNRKRHGLNRNTHDALFQACQARADVIVHLEDDTVPSPDALRYFDWAAREVLMPDTVHSILLASGYNRPKSEPRPEESYKCGVRAVWTAWGWAVDRTRLRWLIANWCFRNPKCFTCVFRWRYRRTRREVFPHLSRVQNIGYELGENKRTPEWYRSHHRTPWVAGELPPGRFEIPAHVKPTPAEPSKRDSAQQKEQVPPPPPAVKPGRWSPVSYHPIVESKMREFYASLSEQHRRRYVAVEAAKLDRWGVEYLAHLFGCDPTLIDEFRRGVG